MFQRANLFFYPIFHPVEGNAIDHPQKELDEANRSNVLFAGDIATKNEAREMNGLSPVPDGSSFKKGLFINEGKDDLKEQNLAPVVVVEKSASANSENFLMQKNKKSSNTLLTKNENQKSINKAIQLRLFD
jgi:hypothetical protein